RTAITLAEGIIENTAYENWKLDESSDKTVSIKSIREGMVPGTHSIAYASSVDTIEIKHEAHNREGFALGAVIASEWIQGKTGVFSMKDVLNLS
ncbi:MAG TPA: 4-hydroxy-tetrahydrodipicolinate reductase, partial [Maribacter sp.]|nr:4-hydroxy-tetrahydrodipicolinate reductase [Maribacter sp.]